MCICPYRFITHENKYYCKLTNKKYKECKKLFAQCPLPNAYDNDQDQILQPKKIGTLKGKMEFIPEDDKNE